MNVVKNYNDIYWNGVRQIIVFRGLLAKFSQSDELRKLIRIRTCDCARQHGINRRFTGEFIAMIRKLQKVDINNVANIWLDTNIKAHYFIPAQYWKSNLELVKVLLLQATVYVYEDNQKILGFIGINGEYIEGIFVSEAMQSQGIGKILLNYVKETRSKLLLNVYQKNAPAISFYQREGFKIQNSGVDEATGEKDYVMVWQTHSSSRISDC